MPNSKDRSASGEFDEDSDGESHQDDSTHPLGKPGRKKNPNSQAARRDQNRIAQREFRLRKQQRIRDLEARVEILSGGKEEALGELRNVLKDLMAENQTLRTIIRGLSGFIGEGAGGMLPKMGWTLTDFTEFVNRSETDAAWEGYQQRKKANAANAVASSSQSSKRASNDDDGSAARSKKARNDSDSNRDNDREHNGYSTLAPLMNSSNEMYPPSARPSSGGIYTDLMRNPNGSPMFMQSPSPALANAYQHSYQAGYSANGNTIPYQPGPSNPPTSRAPPEDPQHEEEDPTQDDAHKLIHYHLDNFKRNSSYCLPASIRPTSVQKTVPHESVIDGILHPQLRDRMIVLRGRFDLVDCLLEYRSSVKIHGDDVLAHSNWEINEKWLKHYSFLVDPETLSIANRWRRERGEHELTMAELVPADRHTPESQPV